MVKFSKQFEGQLVPEWKEAFVDYSQLKKDIKKMQVLGAKEEILNKPQLPLAQRLLSPFWKLPLIGVYAHKEHGVIQVNKKLESSASKANWYETELPDLFADTEAARDFFLRFDHQLNKVNQFYKGKEREFLEREECLRKQMDIFIKFKDAHKQKKEHISSVNDSKDNPYISFTFRRDDESNSGRSSQFEQNEELQICDSFKRTGCSEKVSNDKIVGQEGNSRSLLNINISLTAPSRTFSSLNYQVWGDMVNQSNESGPEGRELSINKTKLHHAEKMIRGAYIELFKGLGYLQTYRNLNMLAFVKILKKCDKLCMFQVTEKRILPKYLKVAESSYFNCSDKAIKLKYEVEELFVKRFAHNDKRKAMKYLKSRQRKESHATTFFVGFFMGCFAALFVGYCIMAHITGLYSDQSDNIYMETVYPVLSMFSLFFLHLFLYGCNIFMWRKTRINYSFIFGFDPTKELKYWDVFLICNTSMTVVVGVIFAHLTITAKGYGNVQAQAIPGLLTLMFLLVLICPFNIVYRSSRYHFLRVIRNIILSPFYKVVMVDFFMADQLCSQVPMLRNMESVACYYITQSYKTQDYGFCMRSGHYKDLPYTVAFLPYYWRAMQCARRWFDERETIHLLNLGKYVSAMLAAGAMVAYKKERTIGCLYFVVAMSSMTTVYQLYWDFVKDCGLLQSNSRNPWLRNELVLRRKFIYYLSMGLNLILRLAWLQTVIHYNFGSLDYRVTSFFFAALELIRRGHWNFYRLENEHLNNVGKFRIIKTVPLPFHEVDQD